MKTVFYSMEYDIDYDGDGDFEFESSFVGTKKSGKELVTGLRGQGYKVKDINYIRIDISNKKELVDYINQVAG